MIRSVTERTIQNILATIIIIMSAMMGLYCFLDNNDVAGWGWVGVSFLFAVHYRSHVNHIEELEKYDKHMEAMHKKVQEMKSSDWRMHP